MSGGSMDYLFDKVENASFDENGGLANEYGSSKVLRMAFRAHLKKVARALKAIEWNDSGDGDPGEPEAIRVCLVPGAELEAAREAAEQALKDLDSAIKKSREETK